MRRCPIKWFKHDANAILDSKLKKLKLKYGMEGYGLYWYCLECIARNVEAHNLSFELEEDAELIAADTNIHYERVEEMMRFMVHLRLFEQSNGIITCLKMAARTDEYTQKLLKDNNKLRLSRQCPDSVTIKSELIEENRREEKEEKQPRFRAEVFLSQHCQNKQLISDWLKVRKTKKAANTETAMSRFMSEVKKSGFTCEQVLEICCERSWSGFKSEWLSEEQKPHLHIVDHRRLL